MATLGQKGQIECISTPSDYQNHCRNWRSHGCRQQLGFFLDETIPQLNEQQQPQNHAVSWLDKHWSEWFLA